MGCAEPDTVQDLGVMLAVPQLGMAFLALRRTKVFSA
jgi:hypothetical protein